jgi:hypothetical protein
MSEGPKEAPVPRYMLPLKDWDLNEHKRRFLLPLPFVWSGKSLQLTSTPQGMRVEVVDRKAKQ